MKLMNLSTNCQMPCWLSALLEILHCDHVHALCQAAAVTLTWVCVPLGSACASGKPSGVVAVMVTYVVVATDSCVAALTDDVAVTMTCRDLDRA